MKKLAASFFGVFLAFSAAADDSDPMAVCDSSYSGCSSKCDAMENATAECYAACDNSYQKCLDIANGYTPEEPLKAAEAPKPAAKIAKAAKLNNPALEGQDEGAEPNGTRHE